MTQSLPDKPDLRRLRDLARALQWGVNAGEPDALARLSAAFPAASARLQLATAQAVVAREYGFDSWPKLKTELAARSARAEAKAAKVAAKAQRATAHRTLIDTLTDELERLALAGDPVAVVNRKPYGRGIGLEVRDRIAAQPPLWAKVVDVLIEGLGHPNPRVRHECAHALDIYDDGRAAAALSPLIDDPVPRVRRMAMHALVCDACKAAPAPWSQDICRRIADHAITDASVQVRRHAVWSLRHCDAALAAETFVVVLERESDATTRKGAQEGLRQLESA